jgi:hypothetical protein
MTANGVLYSRMVSNGVAWIVTEDGKAKYEWDRRFKAVFEEGEHTKPHKFTFSKAHEATH